MDFARFMPLSRILAYRRGRVLPCRLASGLAGSASPAQILDRYKAQLRTKLPVTTRFENLTSKDQVVHLVGYVGQRRDLSRNLSFVTLRDAARKCEIQIVSNPTDTRAHQLHQRLKACKGNEPVSLVGRVQAKRMRGEDGMGLKGLEIYLGGDDATLEILNTFPSDIVLKEATSFPPEQRHLQLLGAPDVRKALQLRSKIRHETAVFLQARDFLDVETPLLFRSTPEGAREFLVPTRDKGYAYALPQSPQQFKQILIASGVPRYCQFAKCFRDEDLRSDRQPEFTQLDLELAFDDGRQIRSIVQELITHLWKTCLHLDMADFPCMTYNEAMARYGTDKPDLRNPIPPFVSLGYALPVDLISMITPLKRCKVDVMQVSLADSPEMTRQFVRDFLDSPDGSVFQTNVDGAPGIFIYDERKPLCGLAAFGFEAAETVEEQMNLKNGDLIVLQARADEPYQGGSTALGRLRRAIYQAAIKAKLLHAPSWDDFRPLWLVDFPLFSPSSASEPGQGGASGYSATHHPFTSPKTADDVDLLTTDPTKATGEHYDLVINGEEIGGGSRRIHQADMQDYIFRYVLQMPEHKIDQFSHLLDALRAGCPPHAGIALGFDRLVTMMASCSLQKELSMRDVIAFPKNSNGQDPMMRSPGIPSSADLAVYHLQTQP